MFSSLSSQKRMDRDFIDKTLKPMRNLSTGTHGSQQFFHQEGTQSSSNNYNHKLGQFIQFKNNMIMDNTIENKSALRDLKLKSVSSHLRMRSQGIMEDPLHYYDTVKQKNPLSSSRSQLFSEQPQIIHENRFLHENNSTGKIESLLQNLRLQLDDSSQKQQNLVERSRQGFEGLFNSNFSNVGKLGSNSRKQPETNFDLRISDLKSKFKSNQMPLSQSNHSDHQKNQLSNSKRNLQDFDNYLQVKYSGKNHVMYESITSNMENHNEQDFKKNNYDLDNQLKDYQKNLIHDAQKRKLSNDSQNQFIPSQKNHRDSIKYTQKSQFEPLVLELGKFKNSPKNDSIPLVVNLEAVRNSPKGILINKKSISLGQLENNERISSQNPLTQISQQITDKMIGNMKLSYEEKSLKNSQSLKNSKAQMQESFDHFDKKVPQDQIIKISSQKQQKNRNNSIDVNINKHVDKYVEKYQHKYSFDQKSNQQSFYSQNVPIHSHIESGPSNLTTQRQDRQSNSNIDIVNITNQIKQRVSDLNKSIKSQSVLNYNQLNTIFNEIDQIKMSTINYSQIGDEKNSTNSQLTETLKKQASSTQSQQKDITHRKSSNLSQSKRDSKSPVNRKDSKSPVNRKQSKSPVSRKDSSSPVSRKESKSSVNIRPSKSPLNKKEQNISDNQKKQISPVNRNSYISPVIKNEKSQKSSRKSSSNKFQVQMIDFTDLRMAPLESNVQDNQAIRKSNEKLDFNNHQSQELKRETRNKVKKIIELLRNEQKLQILLPNAQKLDVLQQLLNEYCQQNKKDISFDIKIDSKQSNFQSNHKFQHLDQSFFTDESLDKNKQYLKEFEDQLQIKEQHLHDIATAHHLNQEQKDEAKLKVQKQFKSVKNPSKLINHIQKNVQNISKIQRKSQNNLSKNEKYVQQNPRKISDNKTDKSNPKTPKKSIDNVGTQRTPKNSNDSNQKNQRQSVNQKEKNIYKTPKKDDGLGDKQGYKNARKSVDKYEKSEQKRQNLQDGFNDILNDLQDHKKDNFVIQTSSPSKLNNFQGSPQFNTSYQRQQNQTPYLLQKLTSILEVESSYPDTFGDKKDKNEYLDAYIQQGMQYFQNNNLDVFAALKERQSLKPSMSNFLMLDTKDRIQLIQNMVRKISNNL